jgi:two-component system response regulator AtoC
MAAREGGGGRAVELSPILGASARMQRLLKLVARVAPTDSAVLILGESGTGKELVARSLHVLSRRAGAAFVPVNMAALPETLVDSELFGYARGAFTGAAAERAGLVEEADGGTLFLDEVGDMPLATQVRLLRVLENHEVRRVGENMPRRVDVRVVAATHRDLHERVAAGLFREDLFYRLHVIQIDIPPLRERREDIGLLATYFLDRAARRLGRRGLRFAPESTALLERYDYPGNVRELENAVEHAAALAEGDRIVPGDLPAAIRSPRLLPRTGTPAPAGGAGRSATATADLHRAFAEQQAERDRRSLEEVTREHVLRVLERHAGNATTAARQLGVSRTTLWRMLKRWGLSRSGGAR